MADGFINAIGSATGDADSVRVTYDVAAGLLIDQRQGIDCTGYESVIIMARVNDDTSDYFVEAWFYDDDPTDALTRGASMVVQGRGWLIPPYIWGAREPHWIQVPVTGKYMFLSVDPGRVSGVATTNPLTVTYVLSHRKVDKVQGFMAGYLVTAQSGLAHASQYQPGAKRHTSQFTLAVAGAADDRAYIYPPCGLGLVRTTVRLNHTTARNVTCYAQSSLLDPTNLNFYNGFYNTAVTYSSTFEHINPAWPLRYYIRNHDASQLQIVVTHTWDDTV